MEEDILKEKKFNLDLEINCPAFVDFIGFGLFKKYQSIFNSDK